MASMTGLNPASMVAATLMPFHLWRWFPRHARISRQSRARLSLRRTEEHFDLLRYLNIHA